TDSMLLFPTEHVRNVRLQMMTRALLFPLLLVACVDAYGQSPSENASPEALQKLANEFWSWRAQYRPFTGDDVPRIERPGGIRDWSQVVIEKERADLAGFDARWKQLDTTGWPIPQQVDYRLIGSAWARCRWDLIVIP